MSKKWPAIPPNDYKGTIADWMVKLMEMGKMKGNGTPFYGDILLTSEEYDGLLMECEK